MAKDNPNRKRAARPLVIAVTSGKGGVGKTSISVNLAVKFVELGQRVLLIDGDLGLANVHIMFGLEPAHSFADLLKGEKELKEILVKGPGGIHILPASSGISELADMNADQQMMILNQLEHLEDRYDVILIDTAAGIGSNVLHFAAAAQYVLVVVTPEPTSLADSYAVIKVLKQKYNVNRFQLLVNWAREQKSALKVYQTLSDIADNFIDVVLDYVGYIPNDEAVHRAITRQKPFVESSPSAPASVHLHRIAQTLLAKRGNARPYDNAPVFWNRFFE